MAADPLAIALLLGTSAGGVGAHVRSLADGLLARGQSVRVGAPGSTAEHFDLAGTGVDLRPVELGDRPRPAADARAGAAVRRLAAGTQVLHAHGLRAGALAALSLTGQDDAPALVVTVHNGPPPSRAGRVVHAGLERVVASRADAVLTVSADLTDRLHALGATQVGPAAVAAPPLGPPSADRGALRAALDVEGERSVLLTVARLADQKGLPVLLDAARRWGARREGRVPLVLVAGDGPLQAALQERIVAERLPVRLLGRRTDVADLLAAADLFVLPSTWEGQPLVLAEALRAGLPVVATAVGGVPALLGDAGVLVPAGDAPALAAAVETLLEDPAARSALGAEALLRAAGLPDPDDVVDGLLTTYRRLADERA